MYTFADSIKRFCTDVLGLRHEQVWGTDEDKNELTKYMWENMPEYIRWDFGGRMVNVGGLICKESPKGKSEDVYNSLLKSCRHPIGLKKGAMTSREIMQVFGTDLCRLIFGDSIWVDDLFRRVERDSVDYAFIPDVRFPSEIKKLSTRRGLIIRLFRDVSNEDCHSSEMSLDDYDWSKNPNALTINGDATIKECRDVSYKWLKKHIKVNK